MQNIDLDLHQDTTTIKNSARSAHVGDDFSVIFCHLHLGGEHVPSFWKLPKNYKTRSRAMRAAKFWVEFGK
jgi:hypothetical protein